MSLVLGWVLGCGDPPADSAAIHGSWCGCVSTTLWFGPTDVDVTGSDQADFYMEGTSSDIDGRPLLLEAGSYRVSGSYLHIEIAEVDDVPTEVGDTYRHKFVSSEPGRYELRLDRDYCGGARTLVLSEDCQGVFPPGWFDSGR